MRCFRPKRRDAGLDPTHGPALPAWSGDGETPTGYGTSIGEAGKQDERASWPLQLTGSERGHVGIMASGRRWG